MPAIVIGINVLFGNIGLIFINGYEVEITSESWVTARKGDQEYFVEELSEQWKLYPKKYNPEFVKKRNPSGVYIDTENPVYVQK